MIIRKPYAFLIKYFKIIHIMLFIFMTYLVFKVRALYMFFRNFLITGTYTHVTDMVSKYVNILMIILTIFLIALLVLIFFLMKQKKKPIFYYLTAIIFYFIMFSSFLFFMSFFKSLDYETYSNQFLVICRDLTMVLYYLNYLFLAIAFIRGFGFNIKKFNFEKDIKELNITDADHEEIELGLGIDVDNVSNYLRRKKRNLGYYFRENSFILITLLIVAGLGLSVYLALDNLLINKTYKESEEIALKGVSYFVNASYLTSEDRYGKYIKDKDTSYLVVDFTIQNKLNNTLSLDMKNTRLKIKDEYYYSKTNFGSKLLDFGTLYKSQKISANTSGDYILVFEIPANKVQKNKMVLEIYSGKSVSNGEATLYYKEVKLNPYQFKDQDLGTYKLTNKVDLSKTYLKKGEFSLNNYEILDVVNYTYTKCDNNKEDGKCVDYSASVVPSALKKIMKVQYTSTNLNKDLFNYLSLSYKKNAKEFVIKNTDIKNITPDNYNQKGVVLLEVSSDIKNLEKVKFIFNLRGSRFSYE